MPTLLVRTVEQTCALKRALAWFEGHSEALVIGPGLPGGTSSDSTMDMQGVLKLLT